MKKILTVSFCIFLNLVLAACIPSQENSEVDNKERTTPLLGSLQPKIITTRTEGELPFHVYVSASGTQMLGVSHPFDEVTYTWDFGDSDGNELFENPVTHQLVNANSDQEGPEASYVYRYSDTYQITLTAHYQLENEILTESTSITLKANEWAGDTRYIDPELGRDESDGLTVNTPWNSWTALASWLGGGDHRRALIKRGTQMPVTHNLNYSSSHIRVGTYGEGDNPVLRASTKIDNFFRLSPANNMTDHVYWGITLDGNNGNASSLLYSALINETQTLTLDHIAVLDMTLINDDPHETQVVIINEKEVEQEVLQASNFISMQNRYASEIHDVLVWNTQFNRNHSFKNGIYAEMKEYFSVVGSSFSGGDGNPLKDHPIYPAGISHALYRWIDFKGTFSNNFSINSAAKDGKILRYTLVDSCSVTGGSNGLDFTKHRSDAVGWFGDLIIQNNAFFNLGVPNQGVAIYGGSLERATIRNNIFYGNPQMDIFVTEENADSSDPEGLEQDVDLHIIGNKFWKGGDKIDTLAMLDIQGVKELSIFDNVLINEGVSGGSTLIAQFLFPDVMIWHIDNNQYWAPEISAPFKRLNLPREYYNFTQWQALGHDEHSVHLDPIFVNPALGEF